MTNGIYSTYLSIFTSLNYSSPARCCSSNTDSLGPLSTGPYVLISQCLSTCCFFCPQPPKKPPLMKNSVLWGGGQRIFRITEAESITLFFAAAQHISTHCDRNYNLLGQALLPSLDCELSAGESESRRDPQSPPPGIRWGVRLAHRESKKKKSYPGHSTSKEGKGQGTPK